MCKLATFLFQELFGRIIMSLMSQLGDKGSKKGLQTLADSKTRFT